MLFAEMIKEARKQADLSQRGLAKLLVSTKKPDGVWATYVGQIEKGEKIPSDDVCIKLAEVLELDSDMVLLTAYQAKAGSKEGRVLFVKMARTIADPVVRRLLDSDEALDPGLLEVLADAEVRSLLKDQPWVKAIARARKARKHSEILKLLPIVEAMNDKQWTAMKGIIETMKLKPPG
jgi:transcriptional regulator with XRE-family HTH domain